MVFLSELAQPIDQIVNFLHVDKFSTISVAVHFHDEFRDAESLEDSILLFYQTVVVAVGSCFKSVFQMIFQKNIEGVLYG